jgi:hypothetical protein
VRRRDFITLVGGAAAWPAVASAQQARHVPIIGYVAPTSPLIPSRSTGAFLAARTSTTLADLVYAAILCRDFFGSAGIAEAVA